MSPKVKPLRLAVCSDIHMDFQASNYGCDPAVVLDPGRRLEIIVEAAASWNADVLMHLGDFASVVTEGPGREALDIWNSFPGEKVAVYGNHDGEQVAKELYLEHMNMPAGHYVRDLASGWRVIVLDSGTPAGLPDTEQLEWFSAAMAAPARCIVGIHGAPWRDVDNVFRERIARANAESGYTKVSAFLFGHTHQTSHIVADGGTHYMEVNSANYRWVEGYGPLFYRTVPFAHMFFDGDGTVACRGFGEPDKWALAEQGSDYEPTDDRTHQVSFDEDRVPEE